MLSAHFQFHEFLVDHTLGRAAEAPVLDSPPTSSPFTEPPATDFSQFIPLLQLHPETPSFVAINPNLIPIQFRLTMEFYYRLEVDQTESKVYILNDRYTINIPKREDALSEIASYGFDILFSLLGIEHVVRVFRSVLLEQKMVFLGSDIGTVTVCALTVLPFALPMSYKSALLPYLPDHEDFLAFLDSPVPYCFGVLNSERLQGIALGNDVTIVDLDNGNVIYPEDIPHLPGATELRTQLKEFLQAPGMRVPKRPDQVAAFWATKRCSIIKKRWKLRWFFTPEEAKRLLAVFTKFLAEFVREEKICGCRVRDTTDLEKPKVGFFKEIYMLGVNPTDTDFFDSFLQTQAFAAYFEQAAM
jgi:hypothetical protein